MTSPRGDGAAVAVTSESIALALRGLAPWPNGQADPGGRRFAVRSHDCETCRAWLAALARAGRASDPAPDAGDVAAGPFGLCALCVADRKTARTLAGRFGLKLVPTTPARALQALAKMDRARSGGGDR